LDEDAVEEELGAEGGEGALDEIVLAGGDASGEEQQVGGEGAFDGGAGLGFAVRRHGEDDGASAGASDLAASAQALELRIWKSCGD